MMKRLCVALLLCACSSTSGFGSEQWTETGGGAAVEATGGDIATGGESSSEAFATGGESTGGSNATGGAKETGGHASSGVSVAVTGGSGATSSKDCKAPAPYDYESCYAYGLGRWMCLDGICTKCGEGALDCDRDPSNYCEINDAANLKANNCCAAQQIGHDYSPNVENCV